MVWNACLEERNVSERTLLPHRGCTVHYTAASQL
jgi:hypothetical protein